VEVVACHLIAAGLSIGINLLVGLTLRGDQLIGLAFALTIVLLTINAAGRAWINRQTAPDIRSYFEEV
jgi:hypothetical protein